MTDPVATPAAAPAAPVAGGVPASVPDPGAQHPTSAERPGWAPEPLWDAKTGALKDEFGQHYTEIAAAAASHKAATEAQAALKARKPEDIKLEVKLPDTVKVPEGMELKVDEKDPLVVGLRTVALEEGLPQQAIDKLIALKAQNDIAAHTAETARLAENMKKLGANAEPRLTAAANWLKGMKDRGELTADEFTALAGEASADGKTFTGGIATTADGLSGLEKLMAKANGAVPGTPPATPPKPEPKTHAERIWPNGFNSVPQARAG